MKPKRQRIIGIDICRSFAIIAAMGSHALITSGAFDLNAGAAMTAVRFTLQLSPPLFIGLFGSMLHIAYRPRFLRHDKTGAIRQLIARAAQCYILYVACVIVQFCVGDFSAGYTLRCILLIGVTPFVDILKFYAVMLLVAPIVLSVSTRYKYGLECLVGAALVPHLAYPFLSALPPPPQPFGTDYLSFPASFAYGGASGAGGPSLLHGFLFVLVGMLIGRIAEQLLSGSSQDVGRARRAFIMLLAASGAATAALWDWQAPYQTVTAIADMTIRNLNHPLYFSLGVMAMTASAWLALETYDRGGAGFGRRVTFIGSSSLFTFSFGNMVLIIAPSLRLSAVTSLGYGALLLLCVLALSWIFRRSLVTGEAHDRIGLNDSLVRFYRWQTGVVAMIQSWVVPLADAYATGLTRLENTRRPA